MRVVSRELGTFVYNENGMLHSYNDQPAAVFDNGLKIWYNNGKLHRENDQPAKIYSDGKLEYYTENKLNRLNGPAVVFPDSEDTIPLKRNFMWYRDGKKHRINGPAEVWQDGTEEWYFDGIHLEEEHKKIVVDFYYKNDILSLINFYNLFILKNI